MCYRRTIRTEFKNRKRAAILTTHYMEEAEAVCDRVAIMVSGQLRLVLNSVLLGGGGAAWVHGWVLNAISSET